MFLFSSSVHSEIILFILNLSINVKISFPQVESPLWKIRGAIVIQEWTNRKYSRRGESCSQETHNGCPVQFSITTNKLWVMIPFHFLSHPAMFTLTSSHPRKIRVIIKHQAPQASPPPPIFHIHC